MGSTSQKLLIYWERRFRGIDVWIFNQKGQSSLEKKWQGKELYVFSKWVISKSSDFQSQRMGLSNARNKDIQ